jgi:hypothetical protein
MSAKTRESTSAFASGAWDGLDASDSVGRFYGWWRGDSLPALPSIAGLTIDPARHQRLVADLMQTPPAALQTRMQQGNQPWLARIAGEPVGWGWVASAHVAIGEINLSFNLPPGNRYLWDFVTLPPWRGRGIYSRMLQAILSREAAERFWVGHDQFNVASARGIVKAGFISVGTVYRLPNRALTLVPTRPMERAEAAAALLNISVARPNVK